TEFIDTGLINGNNYCYKVLAYGHYSAPGFVTPLENWSQEICAIPIDIEPPCSPILHVTADCNSLSNILTWQNVITYCDANDFSHYQVFYSPTIHDDFTLLVNTTDTSYIHTLASTVAGCYYVVAVDTNNNASLPSMKVCSDINSCDLYSLPNVFTPDGDGYNDLFQPFPYDFVEKIHLLVYNRWGNLVFETQDPDINWDGTNMNSGRPVPDGVYYYLCEVYEWRLEGLTSRLLNGSITIIRH
ncbi:MAG TPA: gliding motility-associated C-terminal domain-containing protein, partial [Bacteroidales bacterium]|nr:gliding motility-associated C-terminal domain-containing protein [Bacteroidales bacterium]